MVMALGPDATLEGQPTCPPGIFSEVIFHIVESQTLPYEVAREVCTPSLLFRFALAHIFLQTARLLVENGAREALTLDTVHSSVRIDLEEVSHIISANIDFPGYVEAEKFMIPVVTPEWPRVSLQKKRLAHVRPYNPDPRFFFSGVMVTVAELPSGDKEAICGGVIAMGGQYSGNLTKFTTHIVALNMDNVSLGGPNNEELHGMGGKQLTNSTNLGQVQASNRQKISCQNRPPALVR